MNPERDAERALEGDLMRAGERAWHAQLRRGAEQVTPSKCVPRATR